MYLCKLLLSFLATAQIAFGLPTDALTDASRGSIRDIIVFPNGTWVENIAVRSNGKLLVTLINRPEVWEVEPITGHAELVFSFPNANVSLGITEVGHDVFAVNVGNFTGPGQGVPGSWSLWTLDYNSGGSVLHPIVKKPAAKRVAAIEPAVFLNGLAALTRKLGVVLTGDSFLGQIIAVDTVTGQYSVAIDLPELKRNATTEIQLGVNGIQIRDRHLYFTNSLKAPLFARIPLNSDGMAAGPVQTIAKSPEYPVEQGMQADDFALDSSLDFAWVATNPSNVIVKICLATGRQQVVAGAVSDPVVAGATGAAFGRRWNDKHTLYVVTDGGQVNPTSAGVTGGKIVALDTRSL